MPKFAVEVVQTERGYVRFTAQDEEHATELVQFLIDQDEVEDELEDRESRDWEIGEVTEE